MCLVQVSVKRLSWPWQLAGSNWERLVRTDPPLDLLVDPSTHSPMGSRTPHSPMGSRTRGQWHEHGGASAATRASEAHDQVRSDYARSARVAVAVTLVNGSDHRGLGPEVQLRAPCSARVSTPALCIVLIVACATVRAAGAAVPAAWARGEPATEWLGRRRRVPAFGIRRSSRGWPASAHMHPARPCAASHLRCWAGGRGRGGLCTAHWASAARAQGAAAHGRRTHRRQAPRVALG